MLFGTVGLLIVLIIVSSTHYLVSREQAAIRRQIEHSIGDIADTYEARVLRSLREIDATLKLVDFVATQQRSDILTTLSERNLLPPGLIFSVSIVDGQGRVKESTSPWELATQGDTFPTLPDVTELVVEAFSAAGRQQLLFARKLSNESNVPEWVTLTVSADYFVSGYDAGSLGERGLLALVDAGNITRIARSGSQLTSRTIMALPSYDEIMNSDDTPFLTHWMEVERMTLVRPLFRFPLSIVVGISVEEQLASAYPMARRYWLRALFVSVAALMFLGLLARLSHQLQRERQRVMDERLRHARHIEHLAFHDTLTQLPNRAYLSYVVDQAIGQHRESEEGFALLFLDLDRFKSVNDTQGHEAGDKLLRLVAKRLLASVREHDVVARLGGDEFVILLRNITQREPVTRITEQLVTAIQEPFALQGQTCLISVSIGVALFPHDGADEQTLMKRADAAMYRAKQAGKNTAYFHERWSV